MSLEFFNDELRRTNSAEHLRAVLETTPECVKVVQSDGTLVQMNRSGLCFVGASSSDEVLGKNVFDLISPEYREEWIGNHNRVCKGESLKWQFEIIGLKGEKRFLETHAVPFHLPNNETGQLAVTRDISLQKKMEDELRTSAEQLKTIFQSVHDGILVQDLKFRCIYANETAAKMLGYTSANTMKGESDNEISHRFLVWDENANPIEAEDFPGRKIFAGADFAEAIYRVKCKSNGLEFWTKVSSRSVRDSNGKVIFAVSIFRDITDEKRSAIDNAKLLERTRESEERLDLALTGSKIGLWEWFVKEDKLFFSDRCLEIFGARPETFKSNFHKDFQRFIHPHDVERVNAAVSESVSSQRDYSIEYRTIREIDGKMRWVQARGKPYYDATGNPFRMVGTIIDITDRKEAEDLLRIRARVLESMNEGVSLSDEDGHIIYTNPAEDKLFGYEPGELIGKHVSLQNAYDEAENLQKVNSVIDELKRSGQWSGEWHNKRKDGSTFFTKAHITSLDLGGKKHWVCVQEDITAAKNASEALQKSKEEAIRASQAKSIFLANMSHEIRTPMNAILGFSAVLGDPHLSQAEREDYSRRAQANGNHLLHLIDDILDLSKVEAGQMQIYLSDLSLHQFAEEVYNELKVLVADKKIKTQIEVSDKLPELIQSDEVRLKQVLNNLIGNAAKFTETGFIKLRFSSSIDQQELIIEVEDNGIGIPAEAQENLFKTFSQADNSVTRKYGGTGLGLQLSRKICEALGGELSLVRSDRNQGALFRIVLPLIASQNISPRSKKLNHCVHTLPENLKILLAEDSTDNQVLIKVLLGSFNPKFTVVENGKEAVAQATRNNFDIILMDIQMPEMDGLEATRRIRLQNPKVPILALTAHALPEEVQRSIQAGCNAHLTKPLSKPDLLTTINQFV